MPIIDLEPRGEVEPEYAEAAARYDAFMASRVWRPIGEYDPAGGEVVMLRQCPHHFEAGYFGEREIWYYKDGSTDFGDELPDTSPMWRMAQDCYDGEPLPFEPTEFAEIDPGCEEMVLAD